MKIMTHQVTVKGQVTIPKQVREYLGIGPGSGVEFEMREVYSGWLAHWWRKLLPDPQHSFEIFAVALKQRAEAVQSSGLDA